MAFSIDFTNSPHLYPYEDASVPAAKGLLLLGNDSEGFVANLGEWTVAMYRLQWHHSLLSLLRGERKAVLITTYSSPQIASHLEWWALYASGDAVYVQNQLVFYDNLDKPFSVERATESLIDRQSTPEDNGVSEWIISLQDVRAFIEAQI